jgi:integrase
MAAVSGLIKRNGIYHLRFMLKGILVAESTHTKDRRQAEMILAKRRSELIDDVVLAKIRPVRFGAALNEFLATRKQAASHKNATNSLAHFRSIDETKQLNKITKPELNKIVEGLKSSGYALSTIQVAVNYWNCFIKWAEDQDYTVCSRIESIRGVKGKIRWLTIEEQRLLLDAILSGEWTQQKQDNWDLVVGLLATGCRYNELVQLQWSQVDMERGRIVITRQKGGRDTTLSMSKRLRSMLERRMGYDSTWVFATKRLANNNTHWMRRAVRRAGLSEVNGRINLHTMRHTFCSMMIQNGVSLSAVSHLAGHSSVAITQKYAHFIKEQAADQSAAILDSFE